MPVASHSVAKLTEEQYLAKERAADFKSDYFEGEMFAMSGGSMRHSDLQSNIQGELFVALRHGECRVHGPDFRVRVSSSMYTYPDISVVCGKPVLADDYQDVLLNPVVIFEVLSPSTEIYDRGLKLQRYRTIATLQDYILVSRNEPRVEQYTRQENNLWVLRDYETLDDVLNIASIGISLPMRAIYNRIEIPSTERSRSLRDRQIS